MIFFIYIISLFFCISIHSHSPEKAELQKRIAQLESQFQEKIEFLNALKTKMHTHANEMLGLIKDNQEITKKLEAAYKNGCTENLTEEKIKFNIKTKIEASTKLTTNFLAQFTACKNINEAKLPQWDCTHQDANDALLFIFDKVEGHIIFNFLLRQWLFTLHEIEIIDKELQPLQIKLYQLQTL